MSKLTKSKKILFLQEYYKNKYYLGFDKRTSILIALQYPKYLEIPQSLLDELDIYISNKDVFEKFNLYEKSFIHQKYLILTTKKL